MPLFVFKCESCGKQAEVLQKFEDPNPVCQNQDSEGKKCGGKTHKQVAGGSFHLKGSGWASDGYN